jgi:superfamily II DNA or RNA helicase
MNKAKLTYLILDDATLLVTPSFPALEKALTYKIKSLEKPKDGPAWAEAAVVLRTAEAFKILNETPRVLQTMQGFLRRAVELLERAGMAYELVDRRLNMPEPDYGKLVGLRGTQKDMLMRLLRQDCSGCFCAPTRYGKTSVLINTMRAYPGVRTVVAIPGVDLLRQAYDDIKKSLPHREVKIRGGGSSVKYPSPDITVCSMDSLHKCEPEAVRLLLIDEPHAAVTEGRIGSVGKFNMARKIGYGATLDGRFDNRDLLIEGVIGPVLVNKTYTEAVAEGAICQIVVVVVRKKFFPFPVTRRDAAYRSLFYQSSSIRDTVVDICGRILPPDMQTLLFIDNEKQALHLQRGLEEIGGVIVMAKRMTNAERKEATRRMQDNETKRCIATSIYAQGVTFHELGCVINLEGGGGSISSIQKPGRLAEIRPGKKYGLMIDFLMDSGEAGKEFYRTSPDNAGCRHVENDCWNRIKTYQKKGYAVHIVDSVDEIAGVMNRYNAQ